MTNTQKRVLVGNLIALQSMLAGMFAGMVIGQWQTQPLQDVEARLVRPTMTFQTREARSLQSRMVVRRMQRVAFLDAAMRSSIAAAKPAHSLPRSSTRSMSSASASLQILHAAAPETDTQSASSTAITSATSSAENFPAFVRTVFPVSQTPDWGSMSTPAQWDRSYSEMSVGDFVSIPPYRLSELTQPLEELATHRTAANNAIITAKLFYSTRFFGAYDLDSGEFAAVHPGVDLKLAPGTPIGAIAGGRVEQVLHEDSDLGLHVIIEHHIDGQIYFSIYGHMSSVAVVAGENVQPGQTIGTVGATGFATAPHIHLQIDKDDGSSPHTVYWPNHVPSPAEAAERVAHPITFILQHANGN